MAEKTTYGLRVKNPLSLPVRVKVLQNGTIVGNRVVPAGTTLFLPVPPGEYDITGTIIQPDGDEQTLRASPLWCDEAEIELGMAEVKQKEHVEVARPPEGKVKKPQDEVPIRSLTDMIEEMKRQGA